MQHHDFAHFARQAPHLNAVIGPRGEPWTRGELLAKINAIARGLRQRGLQAGEVVAILAPNCTEFVATYMAATDIGLYVVPINWHLSVPEIAYVLENSGARALFAHERLAPLAGRLLQTEAATGIGVRLSFGRIEGFTALDSFMAGQSAERVPDPVVGRVLMYTSATTGRPKAIHVPLHDAALARARTIGFHLSCGIRLEDDNVHLCASMMYHAAPVEFIAIALHMGHRVVLIDRWEPEPLLRLVQQHRVTTTFMVPAMFIRLLKLPEAVRRQYDTSSLRLVSHSAAPCPQDVKKQIIDWWGPVVWESYGAAEGVGTSVNSVDWLRYPGTVGRPIPGTTLRILDDAGHELPCGEQGTIYFNRFTGDRFEYKNDPEKTRLAYHGDLFSVGDIGYVNADGYLFICDRKIDMIISGGMNVYSAEVEQALVQHPKVLDCAVFGVPDELMGEAVCAVVQLIPDIHPDTTVTSDITSFLRERLSTVKIPRRIDYVSQLPRDPNGKLYKRLLREQYRQEAPRGPA